MNVPEWWMVSSGVFFIFGSIFMIIGVVAMVVLVWVLMDLRDSLKQLNVKVEEIGNKVEDITTTVQQVTHEVGTRTSGLARLVDDAAGGAMDVVEKFSPLLIGIAAVFKIVGKIRRKR